MKSDERARQNLRRRLEEVLGEEDASTLMANLPSEEFVTKDDIGLLKVDIGLLKVDIGLVKADIASFRREVKLELTGIEERFDLKLEGLEHRLTATFRGEMIVQTRSFIFTMVATVATMGSLVVAAASLN